MPRKQKMQQKSPLEGMAHAERQHNRPRSRAPFSAEWLFCCLGRRSPAGGKAKAPFKIARKRGNAVSGGKGETRAPQFAAIDIDIDMHLFATWIERNSSLSFPTRFVPHLLEKDRKQRRGQETASTKIQ